MIRCQLAAGADPNFRAGANSAMLVNLRGVPTASRPPLMCGNRKMDLSERSSGVLGMGPPRVNSDYPRVEVLSVQAAEYAGVRGRARGALHRRLHQDPELPAAGPDVSRCGPTCWIVRVAPNREYEAAVPRLDAGPVRHLEHLLQGEPR